MLGAGEEVADGGESHEFGGIEFLLIFQEMERRQL